MPGAGPDRTTVAAAGFDTVDPTRLIGAPGGPVDAAVRVVGTAVRAGRHGRFAAPTARLTEAGAERLARVLVASL